MKKILFVLVFICLISIVFAQDYDVTLDQAQQIVTPHIYQGEALDIKPQELTYSETTAYWVMEAVSLGKIQVMFPVDAETGDVETSSFIKDVLKTHYLANFFVTDDTFSDFLSSELTFAQHKTDDFSNAKTQFEFYENQFDENVQLNELNNLKSALTNGKAKAQAVRSQIISTQSAIVNIDDVSDVSSTQDSFNNFLSKENAFLNSVESIGDISSDFMIELAGNDYLKINRTDLLQALQGVMTSNRLTESVTARKDSLTQNENTIDSFFADLDAKADGYYVKLNNRLNQSVEEQARRVILEKIGNYSNQYQNLSDQGQSLPSSYRASSGFNSDIEQLYDLLEDGLEYCSGTSLTECQRAEDDFDEIETLISRLESDIENYGRQCTSGQTQSCTTATGESGTQTCTNGVWGTCVAGGGGIGLNWTLIIGLIVILALLILYKFKDKIFGGGKVEEETSEWASYKF